MKARLEELQAKLDDSNRTNQITDTKTAKTASTGSRLDENRTDGLDRTATLESPFEVAPARSSTTQPSDASSNHLAAQSDRDSQVRGKGTYDITGHDEQSHRDYANNMARQEETMSNGLMGRELKFAPERRPEYANDCIGTVAMAELSQQGCPSIMPENDESVDFFLGSLDTWKPEEFAQLIHQTPSPLDLTGSDAPSTAAASASLPLASSLENLASLDAKFELVMECVGAAGFGSFDALVKSYYGDAFGEGSRLSNEQRLSRSRRLPSVLSDIVRSAGSWGAWERRGLYEEVLKAAEEALIGEHGRAGSAMDDCIAPVVESEGNPSAGCVRRAIAALTSAAPTSVSGASSLIGGREGVAHLQRVLTNAASEPMGVIDGPRRLGQASLAAGLPRYGARNRRLAAVCGPHKHGPGNGFDSCLYRTLRRWDVGGRWQGRRLTG